MTVTVFTSGLGDETARGVEFGRAWRSHIEGSWDAYRQVFAENEVPEPVVRRVADETFAAGEAWAPELAAEILGIARGAGMEPWQVAALNARSEVLAAGAPTPGECSTSVFVPPTGPPRTVQTWDWHRALGDSTLVWQYDARPGWSVKTFTEFGLLAKIGVNSAGLGVHFNLLRHVSDGASSGVPVHLLARRILDQAATVSRAEELIRSAPVSASVTLTVVSHDGVRGDACTFEVCPTGVARIDTDAHGFLRHTNHFLDPALAEGEQRAVEDADSRARLSALERRTDALRSDDFAVRMCALREHREDGSALCCHPEEDSPWQTHAVIGLEVDSGRLLVQDGSPCTATEDSWVHV
jgi:isopenicillin-N N-acyltransferase-like protein